MGRSGKASKPACSSHPTWTLQPSVGSHVEACSEHLLGCRTACLGCFGYYFIFIYIYKTYVQCFSVLSPLQCVSILGDGAKVAAAIYIRERCMDPGTCSVGWAQGCLPEGFKGLFCKQRWFFFFFFALLWLFHFISIDQIWMSVAIEKR